MAATTHTDTRRVTLSGDTRRVGAPIGLAAWYGYTVIVTEGTGTRDALSASGLTRADVVTVARTSRRTSTVRDTPRVASPSAPQGVIG